MRVKFGLQYRPAGGQIDLRRFEIPIPSSLEGGPTVIQRFLRRGDLRIRPGLGVGRSLFSLGTVRVASIAEIHALTDRDCRPIAFLLAGGQIADCTAGSVLLEQIPAARILNGDKGYDSNAIRRQVEEKGAMPNIPPKANRRWKNCFSPVLYRDRNAIERMFCRLKDFRRVASDMTAWPSTSSQPSALLQPSATGYESGP